MPDFSINDEQIKAVAKKLSDVKDSFTGMKAPGPFGNRRFGSLSLALTHAAFTAKIAGRCMNIVTWHASTDAALHDTTKQSEQNDQQWAALFRSDLKTPL